MVFISGHPHYELNEKQILMNKSNDCTNKLRTQKQKQWLPAPDYGGLIHMFSWSNKQGDPRFTTIEWGRNDLGEYPLSENMKTSLNAGLSNSNRFLTNMSCWF